MQAVFSVFFIFYAHCLVLENSTYVTVLCYVVELLDEDPMVDRIVCADRLTNAASNHTSLETIFYMLCQVKQLSDA